MRNSFFLLLAVACIFTQVQAEESVDTSRDLSGFYVGFDLSHDWSTARNYSDHGKAKRNDELKIYRNEVPGFVRYKRTKADPVISLGYSHKFSNNFLIGASAEAAFGKTGKGKDAEFIKHRGEEKVKGCTYGLKVKGGYYLSWFKTSVYGIAGLKWKKSDFQIKENMLTNKDPGMDSVTAGKTMPVLGFGFERKLIGGLSCSLEYEYFWKRSTSISRAANPSAENHTPTTPGEEVKVTYVEQHIKSSLHGHSVRVGFKYYL